MNKSESFGTMTAALESLLNAVFYCPATNDDDKLEKHALKIASDRPPHLKGGLYYHIKSIAASQEEIGALGQQNVIAVVHL